MNIFSINIKFNLSKNKKKAKILINNYNINMLLKLYYKELVVDINS